MRITLTVVGTLWAALIITTYLILAFISANVGIWIAGAIGALVLVFAPFVLYSCLEELDNPRSK